MNVPEETIIKIFQTTKNAKKIKNKLHALYMYTRKRNKILIQYKQILSEYTGKKDILHRMFAVKFGAESCYQSHNVFLKQMTGKIHISDCNNLELQKCIDALIRLEKDKLTLAINNI